MWMRSQISNRMDEFSPFYVMELLQRAKVLEAEGRDIIHMEIGEPDFPTPKTVVKAGIEQIKQGEIKYLPAQGLPQLREKISWFYQEKYRVKVEPSRIFISPGASGAFLLALGVSLNPRQEVLMADPCYPCNENFVKFFGGHPSLVNVDANTNYQLTSELIVQNWSENSHGVLIASPSNPTGTVIEKTELKKCIDWVAKQQGSFYSDEIYHGLHYQDEMVSALNFSQDVFVINSFSKYFAMTGWRIGWLIVPDQFIDPAERLAQNIFISTATHSQHAALAAFSEANLNELEARKKEFQRRRDFLYENLIKLGFNVAVKPQGAFYIYADCSRFTEDSFQFARDLLEEQGVAVTPGKDFGKYKANCYIRLAYTVSIAKMTHALERIEKFICR